MPPRIAPMSEFEPLPVRLGSNVFVLTGAGVSAESGIPTYRDANGLWHTTPPEEVAAADAFQRNPAKVWSFISQRREKIAAAQPNGAHQMLATLEGHLADWLFLCTQNIDDLHERAGSRWAVHMHGQIFKSRCTEACDAEPVEDRALHTDIAKLPRCAACGALMRPHIVAFGEMPLELTRIHAALAVCDLFVAVGTSGVVEPASRFVSGLRKRAVPPRLVFVGPEVPENADGFDEVRLGRAVQAAPTLFKPEGVSALDG